MENSLRLANQVTTVSSGGLVTIEGHIEICISGSYFAICDEGWDDQDAQVACRVLTNNTGSYSMLQCCTANDLFILSLCVIIYIAESFCCMDENFTRPSWLCMLWGMNFFQCGKGRHIFNTVINI